jgi:DNA-binding response OmpR family regulator
VIRGHADGAEEVTARPVNGEIPSPGGPAGETILVLEDDAAILKSIHRALERAGYTVLTASTAVEAIELAADHEVPIRLLLTDFGLHPVTGRQVAAVLLRGRPGLRVLYVSGRAEAEVLPHGRPAAGTAFLPKPFTMEALLRQVRELLDQGRVAG